MTIYRGAYWTDGEREVTLTLPQNSTLSEAALLELARQAAAEEGLDLSRGQIQIGTREYLTAADMMRPQRRDDGGITLHDDGTVSYWSVYERHWRRDRAGAISHRDLAAMREDERTRIRQHAARATES